MTTTGDAQCVNRIKNEPPLQHPFPLCFLRPIHRDGRFLRICKQGEAGRQAGREGVGRGGRLQCLTGSSSSACVVGWVVVGTLQFVIVKPVMAVVTLIVISKGQYESAAYQAFQVRTG